MRGQTSDPSIAPSFQTVIDIFMRLQDELNTASLAYWVAPNTVLTLSGARAYCDGVFYSKDARQLGTWVDEMKTSIDTLKNIIDLPYAHAAIKQSARSEMYAGYDILTSTGIEYALKKTNLLNDVDDIIDQKLVGQELMDALCVQLKLNPALQDFGDKELTYTAFGILLGYPDKAIVGSHDKWNPKDVPYEEQLVDARIEAADRYHCPQPIYSYPRNMADDPDIKAHEQLWSSILTGFYESDFHKQLSDNPDFQIKATKIGLYEKYTQ